MIIIPMAVFVMSGVLVVPFFTLLERKVLSYIQSRKGPKKVSMMGLLQPIADGVKLMMKGSGKPISSKKGLFFLSPLLKITVMVFLWTVSPMVFSSFSVTLGVLFFVCVSSVNVYTLIGSAWSSNSSYSLLGGIRGAAQTMSYEVILVLLILFPCLLNSSLKFLDSLSPSAKFWVLFSSVLLVWIFSMMAETNRAPFDFAEGESELVSGFNTEYSSLPFALLFIAEYGSILFLSFLTSFFFFFMKSILVVPVFLGVSIIFLWSRASFPRFRYDFLMSFSWKIILPLVMIIFLLMMYFL